MCMITTLLSNLKKAVGENGSAHLEFAAILAVVFATSTPFFTTIKPKLQHLENRTEIHLAFQSFANADINIASLDESGNERLHSPELVTAALDRIASSLKKQTKQEQDFCAIVAGANMEIGSGTVELLASHVSLPANASAPQNETPADNTLICGRYRQSDLQALFRALAPKSSEKQIVVAAFPVDDPSIFAKYTVTL